MKETDISNLKDELESRLLVVACMYKPGTFDGKSLIDIVVNGRPITSKELIQMACERNESYAKSWLKQTSYAARLLRKDGFVVEDNPNWKK